MSTGADPASTGTRLPYPHARNDCGMCRERDADVHVLGAEYNLPGKRPLLLCAGCLGLFGARLAYFDDAAWQGEPITVSFTIAPGRRQEATT